MNKNKNNYNVNISFLNEKTKDKKLDKFIKTWQKKNKSMRTNFSQAIKDAMELYIETHK